MRDFKKLVVWQKSHQLTLEIYRLTTSFPRDEVFGLTSQLRRAASSIGANIAEGCGRDTTADFSRFLTMAMGSASEVESHLHLAHDLGHLSAEDFEGLTSRTVEVKRMLTAYLRRVRGEG